MFTSISRPATAPVFRPNSTWTKVAETPGWSLDVENDWKFDGDFVVDGGKTLPRDTPPEQLKPFTPNNGAEAKGDLVMVNGIMTDVALQTSDLQAMANEGYRVIGVHNATKGMVADLAQCVADKMDFHIAENGAISTTVTLVRKAIEKDSPINLVGHSQGALIISAALGKLRNNLLEGGFSKDQAEHALAKVNVTSLGGAAATYPKGPAYTHIYNTKDAVPMLAGRPLVAKLLPDSKETLYKFSLVQDATDLPPWKNGISNRLARYVDQTTHGPQHVYLPRLPDNGVVG